MIYITFNIIFMTWTYLYFKGRLENGTPLWVIFLPELIGLAFVFIYPFVKYTNTYYLKKSVFYLGPDSDKMFLHFCVGDKYMLCSSDADINNIRSFSFIKSSDLQKEQIHIVPREG